MFSPTFILIALFALVLGALLTQLPGRTIRLPKLFTRWAKALAHDQQGGYVHDTAMSQYIPPTVWSFVTGTFTHAAGAVAGTIAMNRAAANETSVITIPIMLPSNSVAQKGAYLKTIEVDYENFTAEATSLTWTLNKVTRGADTAVAVVAAVTKTDAIGARRGARTTSITCSSCRWSRARAGARRNSMAPSPTTR